MITLVILLANGPAGGSPPPLPDLTFAEPMMSIDEIIYRACKARASVNPTGSLYKVIKPITFI